MLPSPLVASCLAVFSLGESNISSSGARLTKRKKEITRLYWNHSAAKRDVQSAGYSAQLHIPFWGRDDFDCEAQRSLRPTGALHKAARAFLD